MSHHFLNSALRAVQALFQENPRVGLVNETHGSYLMLENTDGQLHVTFYTSGLFDLFPIKRTGLVQFCDDGSKLKMVGLERNEELKISGFKIEVGKGGPKGNYVIGLMPEPLKRLHHIPERGLASEQP